MNFTVKTVATSLASYLSAFFPDVTFYENPNQQNTKTPCMFLQQRYSEIKPQSGGYYLRKIGLDLTYLEDYNLPNLQELYQNAAEILDLCMGTFPYTDGVDEKPTLIRTHKREWRIDLDAMHYKFELQVRVKIPVDAIKMQQIEKYTDKIKITIDGM